MPVTPGAGQTPENKLANALQASAEAWHEIERFGWIDVLEHDPRPAVVLDLNAIDISKGNYGRVYVNTAYRHLPPDKTMMRFDETTGTVTWAGSAALESWAFGPIPAQDPMPITTEGGWSITRLSIRGRYRMLQGYDQRIAVDMGSAPDVASAPIPIAAPRKPLEQPMSSMGPISRSPNTSLMSSMRPLSKSPHTSLTAADMSRSVSGSRSRSSPPMNPVDDLSRHNVFKTVDWSNSVVGPPDSWPRWKQQVVSTILADPDPCAIIWKDRAVLYNEATIPLISSKHRHAIGNDAALVFEELWPSFEPLVTAVQNSHKCQAVNGVMLPMNRHGFLEETHWKIVLLPLYNEIGECVGVMDRFSEMTASVIAARRLEQINLIGEKSHEAASLDDLWKLAKEAMSVPTHTMDTPWALMFSLEDDKARAPVIEPAQSIPPGIVCRLKMSIGIDEDTQARLASFQLSDSFNVIAKLCSSVVAEGKLAIFKSSDETLPKQLQIAVEGRGHGDITNAALGMAMTIEKNKVVAILIKGLNPRRPVDADYLAFARLITRRLQDLFLRVAMPSAERLFRKRVEEDAMEQSNLAQQLMLRMREAEDEAAAFTKLAENAPIGMYMYSAEGHPIFINDHYFTMTGLRRVEFVRFAWVDGVYVDDREMLMGWWNKLYNEKRSVTFEFRMAKPYMTTAQNGTEVETQSWALASAFPQLDDSGEIVNVVGWQIDISAQKYAESLQQERLKEALESRAQAHRFIDMVSHECRNPLSAILQSADGILTSLSTIQSAKGGQQDDLRDTIETVQDSAQTIVLCAQHQKRIVDDILTVSKLDGDHLIITPDKADPVALINHVLKMYEAEMQSDHIQSEVVIHSGYKMLEIDYVLLDPSRTLQVLINLVTNAVKFTAPSKKKQITVSIDASRRRPPAALGDTNFIPQRTAKLSPHASHPEWATGRDLYVTFSVTDTGRGMTDEEMKKLFERFAQASPRTHIKYGGSGLGLFISRQLTELQGGQIGVSSKLGSGSTFTFYILARTSTDPAKAAITPVYTPGPASSASSQGGAYPFPRIANRSTSIPESEGPIINIQSTSSAGPTSAPTNSPSLAPGPQLPAVNDLHVLIVEDNLINQKVMAKQLRNIGCTVHVANHGVEAIEFLRCSVFAVFPPCVCTDYNHSLDVVLMDIEMPVMGGIECIREIRAMERRGELNGHVPVIAVTANARDAQQADALKEGMDQVITKPFRIPELVPKMQGLALDRRTVSNP